MLFMLVSTVSVACLYIVWTGMFFVAYTYYVELKVCRGIFGKDLPSKEAVAIIERSRVEVRSHGKRDLAKPFLLLFVEWFQLLALVLPAKDQVSPGGSPSVLFAVLDVALLEFPVSDRGTRDLITFALAAVIVVFLGIAMVAINSQVKHIWLEHNTTLYAEFASARAAHQLVSGSGHKRVLSSSEGENIWTAIRRVFADRIFNPMSLSNRRFLRIAGLVAVLTFIPLQRGLLSPLVCPAGRLQAWSEMWSACWVGLPGALSIAGLVLLAIILPPLYAFLCYKSSLLDEPQWHVLVTMSLLFWKGFVVVVRDLVAVLASLRPTSEFPSMDFFGASLSFVMLAMCTLVIFASSCSSSTFKRIRGLAFLGVALSALANGFLYMPRLVDGWALTGIVVSIHAALIVLFFCTRSCGRSSKRAEDAVSGAAVPV